jgi:UDPglucose 6-dehydrogenase
LCKKLKDEGAELKAYDPAVDELADEYSVFIDLCDFAENVFFNSDAVVVCTEWPEFKDCLNDECVRLMKNRLLVDINGFFDDIIQTGTITEPLKQVVFGRA